VQDSVTVALVSGFFGVVTSTVSAIGLYFTKRSMEATEKTEKNTNHMHDEIVAAVKIIAYAKGHKKGFEDGEK